jgi:hypothetical protein
MTKSQLAFYGTALAAIAASFVISPHQATDGPILCPFRRFSGLPCPGCGLTRSWVSFAHGDVSAAFDYHAFGPLLFVTVVVALGVKAFTLITGRQLSPPTVRVLKLAAACVVAIWLGWSLVRLVRAI